MLTMRQQTQTVTCPRSSHEITISTFKTTKTHSPKTPVCTLGQFTQTNWKRSLAPSIIICKRNHPYGLPFCPAFTIYVNEMYLTFLQTAKLFNNIDTYEIAEKTPKTQFQGNMTKSAVIHYESWSESVWQSPSSRIAMASCQDYPLTSSAAPKYRV